MQPLELNLAFRPFKNNTLPWAGYGIATIVLVLFTIWNVHSYSRHRTLVVDLAHEVSTIDLQFRDLDKRRIQSQQAIRGYDLEALAIQAEKADDVIRWKAFSWTRLFNLLEKVQPDDVRMTSVHPIFRSGEDRLAEQDGEDGSGIPVSVEGVAKDHAAFLDLERALLADVHFDRVEPSRTAREKVTDHTIFDLRFSYDPEATSGDSETVAVVETVENALQLPADEAADRDAPEGDNRAPEIERRQLASDAVAGGPGGAEVVAETGFGTLGEPAAAGADREGVATEAAGVEGAPPEGAVEEVFPENPPSQKQPTPRVRRPQDRKPTPSPPTRRQPQRRATLGGG